MDSMDTVVTDSDDFYTTENTSLRKSIHDFLVASAEKGKKNTYPRESESVKEY